MLFSLFVTTLCISKLLEARSMCNAQSYQDLGFKAYGKKGKQMVNIFLVLS